MSIESADNKSIGQINFEAYAAALDNRTYDDKPIPQWSALPPKVQAGWERGAEAVIEAYDPDGIAADEDEDEDLFDDSDLDDED